MKILYHHRTASRDGQEVHITELIGALRRLGHDVEVISPGGGSDATAAADMGGSRGGAARLRALIPEGLMPVAARLYEEVMLRKLIGIGRKMQVDFVYERHALNNHVGVRGAPRLGVPLLLEVNSPLAREEAAEGNLRGVERAVRREVATLNQADAILAVTGPLKEILVADGVDASKIHVIQNGVALERFSTPRQGLDRNGLGLSEGVLLGFIGFPRPWHGLDRVIRAMAASSSSPLAQASLLIGGEGPALPDLRRLADELGVADRVRFHGVLRRDEVRPFLDTFDVALQPAAVAYASPLKLFEYLARGIPVIAPNQPNLTEVLQHDQSAILFDPADEGSFARELDRLVADRGLRDRIGAGGRSRIETGGFTWQRNAERVCEIAQRLIAEGGR